MTDIEIKYLKNIGFVKNNNFSGYYHKVYEFEEHVLIPYKDYYKMEIYFEIDPGEIEYDKKYSDVGESLYDFIGIEDKQTERLFKINKIYKR